ncbi:MAG: hypothetical protein RJA76_130 [Bacteroidota bacterium]|jgi:AraC-like DNA-binding protein
MENLSDFYLQKFNWIPEEVSKNIGHFNVFPVIKYDLTTKVKPLPYRRRDYFKIMLVWGDIDVYYADKVIAIKKPSLVFSNPQIPYKCERLENIEGGFYCIFNQQFFENFGNILQYSLFQPGENHVFELQESQVDFVKNIYARMFEEIKSEYVHKFDVLRNLVFELFHVAMKMQPVDQYDRHPMNASQRISGMFFELLERQFPIDENFPKIQLRAASDFAHQLNVHVNHLNRSIKEVTEKTTTQIIGERIMQEARVMLRQSNFNISDIAYALGFQEVTHFNNFFKKHVGTSPLKFRNTRN